jgi:hypothetical protein
MPAAMISTESSWEMNSTNPVTGVNNSPNKIIKTPTTILATSPLPMITPLVSASHMDCMSYFMCGFF